MRTENASHSHVRRVRRSRTATRRVVNSDSTLTRKQLNAVGLRATLPRVKILQVLRSHERRHLSAEDVHRRFCEQNGRIGLPTVYRVLGQLTDVGILERHIFNAGAGKAKAVYEIRQDKHHDHLICRECWRVDEFVDENITERSRGVAVANGYTLSEHQLALYGYCQECWKLARLESAEFAMRV
jgi:Fur family transcriptional regulator, ferric uptake regulator